MEATFIKCDDEVKLLGVVFKLDFNICIKKEKKKKKKRKKKKKSCMST